MILINTDFRLMTIRIKSTMNMILLIRYWLCDILDIMIPTSHNESQKTEISGDVLF